jgi:hypothetical protein
VRVTWFRQTQRSEQSPAIQADALFHMAVVGRSVACAESLQLLGTARRLSGVVPADLATKAEETREEATRVESGARWNTDVVGSDHCAGPVCAPPVDSLATGLGPFATATCAISSASYAVRTPEIDIPTASASSASLYGRGRVNSRP